MPRFGASATLLYPNSAPQYLERGFAPFVVRIQIAGLLKHGDRLLVPPQLDEARADIDMSLRAVRPKSLHEQVLLQRIPEMTVLDEQSLQSHRRRACADLDLDFFQQFHGAGLLPVQLHVQLEVARLRALLALAPTVVARRRAILSLARGFLPAR